MGPHQTDRFPAAPLTRSTVGAGALVTEDPGGNRPALQHRLQLAAQERDEGWLLGQSTATTAVRRARPWPAPARTPSA